MDEKSVAGKRWRAGAGCNEVVKCFQSSQTLLSMLLIQVIATGLYLLSRIILSNGSFIFALITYRHVVAAICVAPFAFFFERSNWNIITGRAWFWMFINSLAGIIMAMGLYYYGLRDTNATYATNFLNLVPILTFSISVTVGTEKLRLKTKAGRVKIVGGFFCVVGALVVSLYKGPGFYIDHINWSRKVNLYKEYPFRYTTTAITCIMAAAEASVIGVCLDRRRAAWSLGWDMQLVTIVYSGALASTATFCLILYVVSVRGPTYPPMFNPLSLIFTALLEALFLGEKLTLGNLLGTLLIIFGLYSFLWGQKKDSAESNKATAKLDEPEPPQAPTMTTEIEERV
uniref:WAT1-related protein n=1 Tax=Kalanchoe fedtschenkoi TaxID=63787 RepID=A0A7N0V9Q4_KALFE